MCECGRAYARVVFGVVVLNSVVKLVHSRTIERVGESVDAFEPIRTIGCAYYSLLDCKLPVGYGRFLGQFLAPARYDLRVDAEYLGGGIVYG